MQVAAITYCCDQNEPSSPFPLTLQCQPTRAGVEGALGAYLKATADTDPGCPLEILRYDWDSRYGDLTVELEGGTYGEYLIIGFEADSKLALDLTE